MKHIQIFALLMCAMSLLSVATAGSIPPTVQRILNDGQAYTEKAKVCDAEDGAASKEKKHLAEGGYKDRAALDALRRKMGNYRSRWVDRLPLSEALRDVRSAALSKEASERFADAVSGIMMSCSYIQALLFYNEQPLGAEARGLVHDRIKQGAGVSLTEYELELAILAKLSPHENLKKFQAEAEAFKQVLRADMSQDKTYDAKRFIEALKKEVAWTSQATKKLKQHLQNH